MAGLPGWSFGIDALRQQRADESETAYNSAVWFECRHNAMEFPSEALARLDSGFNPIPDEAMLHYRDVSKNLNLVSEVIPFAGITDEQKEANIRDTHRRRVVIEHLQLTREAEKTDR